MGRGGKEQKFIFVVKPDLGRVLADCPISNCGHQTVHESCRYSNYANCPDWKRIAETRLVEFAAENFTNCEIFRGPLREWRRAFEPHIFEALRNQGVTLGTKIAAADLGNKGMVAIVL